MIAMMCRRSLVAALLVTSLGLGGSITLGATGREICHEDVEIHVPTPAGHVLAGTLSLPAGRERPPAAILVSGAGPHDREYGTTIPSNHAFPDLALALVERGVAVLRYDEVGTGRSTGDYAAHATTRSLADDAEALVADLRQRERIDPTRIVLVGHSEGGAIAGIVAARDEAIAGVVLLAAPALPGAAIMEQQNAWLALNDSRLQRLPHEERVRILQQEQQQRADTEPWFRFFLEYDPLPDLMRVKSPMLVIHGSEDWAVSPDQGRTIAEAARSNGNAAVVLHVLERHDHGLVDLDPDRPRPAPISQRVRRAVVTWVAAVTNASGDPLPCERP